jgi:acyl-CoA synthetase (AMP-forming)/AMP-acid ligase II
MPAEILVDPRRAMSISSIPGLLEHHAKRNPDALAILAPGRTPLTYGLLNHHLDQVGRTLRAGSRSYCPMVRRWPWRFSPS